MSQPYAMAETSVSGRCEGSPAAGRQYFIRHSLNTSIRTRRSHLRRSSGRRQGAPTTATAAAPSTRRSGRQACQLRQVRFQPVAQAIGPADHHQDEAREEPAAGEPALRPARLATRQLARMQQQLDKLSRKSRLHLNAGAKPLTRRLHSQLSQLSLAKMKLKSVNSFASQLRQSAGGGPPAADCHQHTKKTAMSGLGATLAGRGLRLLVQKSRHQFRAQSAPGQPLTSSPIQQTFHIRHSAAQAKHQITLAAGGKRAHFARIRGGEDTDFEQTAAHQPAHHDDNEPSEEDGWGSDFDESQSVEEASWQQAAAPAGAYLLEIGRSSGDTRAIHDVIQDQGLSGHFKRLDLSAEEAPPPELSQAEAAGSELEANYNSLGATTDVEELLLASQQQDNDEDDEAELASIEARQGYRQVRDKLKLILDKRLASFERRSAPTSAQSAGNDESAVSTVVVVSGATGGGRCGRQQAPEPRQLDQSDCQSNCSDSGSLTSGGLDSNHSGSQDSGHSTQHSGYSALLGRPDEEGACRRHRERSQPATTASCASSSALSPALQSPAATPTGPVSPSERLEQPHDEQQEPKCAPKGDNTQPAASPAPVSELELERRNRFLQNRRIINHKLESMFKSRSAICSPSGALERQMAPRAESSPKSTQSCPTPPTSCGGPADSLDAALRLRQLEQQRQMSLKLKQKPRRRSAKRALNLISSSSSSSVCAASLDGGATAKADQSGASYSSAPASSQRQPPPPLLHPSDSLTKQLSMVCLRQLQHEAGESCARQLLAPPAGSGLASPRAALSLRQLVKEVIDDCERPARMCTLTREILNRCDSLSSERLSAEAPAAEDSGGRQASQQLSSLDSQSPEPVRSSTPPGCLVWPQAQIKPIGIIPEPSSPATLCSQQQKPRPFLDEPSPISGLTNFYSLGPPLTPNQSTSADYSLGSSLNTIDGLEFNTSVSGLSLGSTGSEQQQQPAATHPTGQHVPSALEQSTPVGARGSRAKLVGAYWRSLRQFSRNKMARVNLAYLDNTSNFFTDDDN